MPRQLRAQSVVRQYFVPTVPQANYMAAKQTSTAAWAGEESVRGGPVLLHNGGTAEVTDRRPVPMGDTRAYPGLTYVDPGDDDRPAVRIVFSVERGVPQCVGLSFTAAKRIPVRGKNLRSLKLDDILATCYAYVGVFIKQRDGVWTLAVGRHVREGRVGRAMLRDIVGGILGTAKA